MKVNISFISTKHYDRTNWFQWVWIWRRYKVFKGIFFRIMGVNFNIREKNILNKIKQQQIERYS